MKIQKLPNGWSVETAMLKHGDITTGIQMPTYNPKRHPRFPLEYIIHSPLMIDISEALGTDKTQ